MAGQRCRAKLCATSGQSLSGHLGAILSAPRRLQEPPRGLQDSFQKPQDDFRCLSSDSGPIFYYCVFSPPQKGLGTSKITKILCAVFTNQGFAILSSNRLLSSIWHPVGSLSGSPFAPKMAENSLGFPLGAAKSRSRVPFFRAWSPPGAL